MRLADRISERLTGFRAWRLVIDFWTGVFFGAIVYDFFHDNVLDKSDIMVAIAAIYVAILAFYSAEKEFRRWHHMHTSMHPGELYVLIWTLFVVALILAQALLHYHYEMPPEVSASYIAVVSILALTRESKNWYKKKDREVKGGK